MSPYCLQLLCPSQHPSHFCEDTTYPQRYPQVLSGTQGKVGQPVEMSWLCQALSLS